MAFIPSHIVSQLNSLSTEDVAERLGIGKVFHHSCRCFMHEDHHPSLKFLGKDRQDWRCFVCNRGGHGPISLVMEKEGVQFIDACRILCDMYGIFYDKQNDNSSIYRKPRKLNPLYSTNSEKEDPKIGFQKDVAEWIVKNAMLSDTAKHFLFSERQLSEKIVMSLNIGSISYPQRLRDRLSKSFSKEDLEKSGLIKAETGNINLFTPCLVFPYFDIDGELVDLQFRYLGKKSGPRFQFISNQKPRIFNLPILRRLKKGDDLYLAEGVTDCLALLSSGHNAVALPSATLIPEQDLYLLREYNLKMFPDVDRNNVGMKCFYEIQSMLIRFGSKIEKLTLPLGFKDYGDFYSSLKSPKNAGN
jgi:DNA primase